MSAHETGNGDTGGATVYWPGADQVPYQLEDTCGASAPWPGVDPVHEHNFRDIIGAPVYSADGDFLGEAWQVYLGDDSKHPEWLTVRTSLFRSTEHFVPLAGATMSSEGVWVIYDNHTLRHAPRVSTAEGHMSRTQRAALHRHYGLGEGRRPPTRHRDRTLAADG